MIIVSPLKFSLVRRVRLEKALLLISNDGIYNMISYVMTLI